MRKVVHVKIHDKEIEMLRFICGTLRTSPSQFLVDVIPIHYDELRRLLDAKLKEKTNGAST